MCFCLIDCFCLLSIEKQHTKVWWRNFGYTFWPRPLGFPQARRSSLMQALTQRKAGKWVSSVVRWKGFFCRSVPRWGRSGKLPKEKREVASYTVSNLFVGCSFFLTSQLITGTTDLKKSIPSPSQRKQPTTLPQPWAFNKSFEQWKKGPLVV